MSITYTVNRLFPDPEMYFDKDQVVYLHHFPKTSGRTLQEVVEHSIPSDIQICGLRSFVDGIDAKGRDLKDGSRLLVVGHVVFGVVERLGLRPFYSTILRNPVDRFISEFCFDMSSLNPDYSLDKLMQVFVESLPQWHSINLYSRMLSGSIQYPGQIWYGQRQHNPKVHHGEDADSDYKEAISNINQRFNYIGIFEEFELSLFQLCDLLGVKEFSYDHQFFNKTIKKFKFVDLDKTVQTELLKKSKYDRQIYDYCYESFLNYPRDYGDSLAHFINLNAKIQD